MPRLPKVAGLTTIVMAVIVGTACNDWTPPPLQQSATSEPVSQRSGALQSTVIAPDDSVSTNDGPAGEAAQALSCKLSTVCNPLNKGVKMQYEPKDEGCSKFLDPGTGVYINCWQFGDTIAGPWGNSAIWDFVSWSSQYGYQYQGYVSDTYVYTGGAKTPPGVAQCPPDLKGKDLGWGPFCVL